MRLVELYSTSGVAPEDGTLLSPNLRPNLLGDPQHRRQREAIEAALFGGVTEMISVGRFRLLYRLGEGGMGTVYAAFDDRLDRKIAVKLIRPSQREGVEMRERTLREARALARVSHPNVVHVYEVGEIEDQLFVAMEFLAGPTLRDWVDAQQRTWREVLRIFCQAGEGLSAAHAQGIIHRDFKPHNAMLGADGRVRVLDFGLARLGESEVAPTEGAMVRGEGALTMTGAILGTPAYMAPEQWQAGQVSAYSDQFSYCVALFEALYGYRPFVGKTIAHLRESLEAGRVAARPRDTEVPRWVHAVLLRGLSVEASDRWPSMRELLDALARDPRVRRRRVGVGTLAVAFSGALSYAVIPTSEPTSEPEICASAGSEIAEVWSDARAAEVEQTVRAKRGDPADKILAIALPQIDRYADEWSAMRDEACHAHADGQQSENVFDLRNACLDQRLASLDALVQILASGDSQQLQSVGIAAMGLPAIERCADTTALLAAIPPPDVPALRERVQHHRETLARAKVHEDSGQPERGLELVAEVLADADAIAYEPLMAEAYLHKGCLETWTDAAEAEHSLSKALWAALATGHAFVAARASSKRGQVTAGNLRLAQQGKDQLPMIMALNRRITDDPVAYAEYFNDVGLIHMCLSDTREARRWLEAARDLRVARGLPVDWRTVSTLLSLGEITRSETHTLEAVEIYRDVERQLEKIAPSSPAMQIPVAASMALALTDAGRPFDALAELVRCQTKLALVEVPPYQRFGLSWELGRASRLVGDLPASRTYLSEAQALCPAGPTCWNVLHELMLTAAAEGDATAVQTYYEQISAQELDRANRMRMVREHARALGSLGAWPESILELQRAQAMIGGPTEVINATASWEVAFELGRAHRKIGDLATAERELARALVELRALYPVEVPLHAEVLYELGELALDRLRWSEALGHLEEAESIFALTAEDDYLPRARTRFGRARALTGTAKLASPEACELAQAAVRGLRANSKHDEARVVEAWLEASG